MVRLPGLCPHYHSDHVIKGGKIKTGKPRYTCAPLDCPRYALQLALTYKGRLPASKEHIVDMRLNDSGMRDIAQGLQSSPTTVMHELKKSRGADQCQRLLWSLG